MLPLSVVIITKNEARNIADCIRSAQLISADIVVVDAESKDGTAQLAIKEKCNVISLGWIGYGHARNIGAAAAENDWILSLDADERITPLLADKLQKEFIDNAGIIYGFRRKNFFEKKEIKYGELGKDRVLRLYNRTIAKWDASPVHEKLIGYQEKRYLNASISHYTINSYSHYKNKSTYYAYLCAAKYLQEGKTATYIKRSLAPRFNFVKSYIFLLGFLDGANGLAIAKVNAWYTSLKYRQLQKLVEQKENTVVQDLLVDLRFNFESSLK